LGNKTNLKFTFTFIIDQSIREAVLSSLDERFDPFLAQAENIRSLFIALNDEVLIF